MINNLINTLANNSGAAKSEAIPSGDSKQCENQNNGFFTAIFQYFSEGGNDYVKIIGTADEDPADQIFPGIEENLLEESNSGKTEKSNELLPNQKEDPVTFTASENTEIRNEYNSGKIIVQKTFIDKVPKANHNIGNIESAEDSDSDRSGDAVNKNEDVSISEDKVQDNPQSYLLSLDKNSAGDENSADSKNIRFDFTNAKITEAEKPVKPNSTDLKINTESVEDKNSTRELGISQHEEIKKSDLISNDSNNSKESELQPASSEKKEELIRPLDLSSVNREMNDKAAVFIKNEVSDETVPKESEPAVQNNGKSDEKVVLQQNNRLSSERLEIFQTLNTAERTTGNAARVHTFHNQPGSLNVESVSNNVARNSNEEIKDTIQTVSVLDEAKTPEGLTKAAEKIHQALKIQNKRSRTDLDKFTTRLEISEKLNGNGATRGISKLNNQQLSNWITSVNHQSGDTLDADTEMQNDDLIGKEFVSEAVESREKNNPNNSGLTFTRLADITISNLSVRKNILPGLSQFVLNTSTKSQSAETWQKHNFMLEDGSKIQLSARSIEGVMHIKINSSMGDLYRLLQLHQQEIIEHLEKECKLEIDLQFENQQDTEQTSFFDDTMKSSRKSQGYQSLKNRSGSASSSINNATAQIRKFGYNQMEWTA